MAIFVDPPFWPAHGTVWSHLVSDADADELHDFAARIPLPRRSYDLDHYDLPEALYRRAVDLGAHPVASRDLVRRLRASGLRVRGADRDRMRPVQRKRYLVTEWSRLGDRMGIVRSSGTEEAWAQAGDLLLARWNEPHRRYHDEQHLEHVLLSLDHLATDGERVSPTTQLAAWFHDAVYEGSSGNGDSGDTDERESARLALRELDSLGIDAAIAHRVGELIVATDPTHEHTRVGDDLAHLLDADLSIFAASSSRYAQYTRAVREEYAHISEHDFREGRSSILRGYLAHPTIYRTPTGHRLWEIRARENLALEIASLTSPKTAH